MIESMVQVHEPVMMVSISSGNQGANLSAGLL